MERARLTPRRINRLFGILIAIFWALTGFLYWQNHFSEIVLALAVITSLVGGILFVFGTRMAQRDGFLDGYARAKDDFDKKRKS